jgi:hypothetical protein
MDARSSRKLRRRLPADFGVLPGSRNRTPEDPTKTNHPRRKQELEAHGCGLAACGEWVCYTQAEGPLVLPTITYATGC